MKLALLAMTVIGLSSPAVAATNLVTNGSFDADVIVGRAFIANNVTGWTQKTENFLSKLVTINAPGTADDPNAPFPEARPGYFTVYDGFPDTSPVGGNFIMSDGDATLRDPLLQTINGLIIGRAYTLTFWQAAAQQAYSVGPTTERWEVSLGAESHLSRMYSLPQGGFGEWEQVSMTFTAAGVSQVLSFLAVGTPVGQPPISFLDGVSLTAAVPEPATWALMIGGFGLVGASLRRRRQAETAVTA